MQKIDQVIIVGKNSDFTSRIKSSIESSGMADQVKMALNGGHAFLFLDHLHLGRKLKESKVLVLLDMDTPIVDGWDFLKDYAHASRLEKENVIIVILNEHLSNEEKSRASKMGANYFLFSSFTINALTYIVQKHFFNSTVRKIRNCYETFRPLRLGAA
ncbi:MAG: response regulator [Sporocytophaga sp.]|uniref:response regulator n=1 Tax=Sporocytophaga TaxID=1011 RepID=UPI00048E8F8A|nr:MULTISPECIES: response regulator [Sporocytophaga]MBO9703022.1 response regulator [Sporocytophaga sp.]